MKQRVYAKRVLNRQCNERSHRSAAARK